MEFLKLVLRRLEKLLTRASKLGNPAFFESDIFAWTAILEDNWRVVRRELDEVLKFRDELPNFQDISPDQLKLSQDDKWKTFFFYAYGFKAKGNCRRCPETARLLRQTPGMKTAFFSLLAPGKHLKPHRGPYKGVIRCHLAVKIPERADLCGIRVGDETAHWTEGKVMLFDDTFEHEAWNRSDEDRVVLFMDVVRPLRFPASFLNWLLLKLIAFSPFVLGAWGNHLAWERRFEKVVNARAEPRTAHSK